MFFNYIFIIVHSYYEKGKKIFIFLMVFNNLFTIFVKKYDIS